LLRVGLTGGIASGKSAVSSLLAQSGIPVIDSDTIARGLVKPGSEALSEIASALGAEVLTAEGALDRVRVGRIVFGDEAKRRLLEEILHPRIQAEQDRWMDGVAAGGSPLAVVEAALMVESGGSKRFDLLVVVDCGEDQQIGRLMERSGMSEEEARARLNSQMPLSEKVKYADRTLDNRGSLEDLDFRAEELARWLREKAREKGKNGD
jgi:dephospho-CoA kinase